MMLLVKTRVKESDIPGAGRGLFADQFISAGTIVWRVDPSTDKIIPNSEVLKYDPKKKEEFSYHAFQSNITGSWIACYDGAQYVNHSSSPNLGQIIVEGDLEYSDIALRDIQVGEELLDNYHDYDIDADRKLSI